MQKQKKAVEFYHDLKIDQYMTYSLNEIGFEIGFRVCDVPVVDMMMIGFIVVVGSNCQGKWYQVCVVSVYLLMK